MIPIYRIIDLGFSGLKNNFATFEACSAGLNQRQTIMIFPEGNTTHEKRMRPLQKGIGRIISGTFQQYPTLEDIYVVPVGVNFTYADLPRREVMIDIGAPIPTKALFEAHGQRAATLLRAQLKTELENRVVIIREEADEPLVEYLLLLNRSTRQVGVFPIKSRDISPLIQEKAVADYVNQLHIDQKAALLEKAQHYFNTLQAHGLEDWALLRPGYDTKTARIAHLFGYIPALVGRLFCYPPIAIAWYIRKNNVERPEFFSPILLGAALGTFFVYAILWILLALLSGRWIVFAAAIILGGLGYFGMLHQEQGARLRVLARKRHLQPDVLKTLLHLRELLKIDKM